MGDLPLRVGSEWRGAQRAGALISLAARRAGAASMAGDPAGSGASAAPPPPARATPSPERTRNTNMPAPLPKAPPPHIFPGL
eukprot:6848341-Alexandrium_andersonii.AAC.1